MCSCVIKYTKNLSPLGTDHPQVVLCTRLTGREWEPTCKSERCTGMTFTPKPCSHCARSPMQRARKYYAFFKGDTVGQKKKKKKNTIVLQVCNKICIWISLLHSPHVLYSWHHIVCYSWTTDELSSDPRREKLGQRKEEIIHPQRQMVAS